ncbi:hypothetical protein DMI62_08975 [Escherichia coli]|nr:hypothetical protein [Escherichia coli]
MALAERQWVPLSRLVDANEDLEINHQRIKAPPGANNALNGFMVRMVTSTVKIKTVTMHE